MSRVVGTWLGGAIALGACERRSETVPDKREPTAEGEPRQRSSAALGAGLTTVVRPLRARGAQPIEDAGAPPVIRVNELEPASPPDACPATMAYITGGDFWMGSARGKGSREESPRFRTRLADYCIDTYEVTSASYQQCVRTGQCTLPHGSQNTCNYGRREDHPINCVDWAQADTYCRSQGARLPSELEWEYAARGGAEYYPFSWGYEAADERTCWKAQQSCPVGSYAPGAFGLHDVSGNVWEWTSDWFGQYPWPVRSGDSKVFRGGGYSRKHDRSLSTTLRSRATPERWGAHLGFRCARLAKDAVCPFGPGDVPGSCRHGVLDVDCPGDEHFNGQRCADRDAPPCGPGRDPMAGFGCVRPADAPDPVPNAPGPERPRNPPARTRAPEHDADCQREQPRRPKAYLIQGGTHPERRRFAKEERCSNQGLGVGWNAVCCAN